MQTAPSALVDALSAEQFRFAWLVELPGPASPLFLTDHAVDIEHDGQTWLSQGDIIGLPTITRERGIKLQGLAIGFSANDGALNAALASRPMAGEACRLSLVFLDATGGVIGDAALPVYEGTFDGWSYRAGKGGDSIEVRVTSPWAKPTQTAGRVTSDHDQTERYPGDSFFAYAHEKKDQLGWGGEA